MKKLSVIVGVLALFLISSCQQEKLVLKVLHYVDATQSGYADDKAIWDKFIADNPDITVQKEELFNEPFHQKVEAYIASGQVPDVQFMWPSGRSENLHAKKLVKDLRPLLGEDFLKDFVPAAVDPNNQSSKTLAELPQSVTYTHAMYVNKGLLESLGLKVPTTYAELKALAPTLKAKGIQTVLMGNKDTWPAQSCLFSTISGRLLGDSFIDDVKAGNAKFTDQAFVDALKFFESLYKDGVISKDTIQLGYGEVPALFAAGKAAILIDGDWRQGAFLTDKTTGKALIDPAKQGSDFVITQFPTIPGEKNPGIVSAIVGVGYGISASIPSGSDKEKAAVRLIKYLYSPEVQKIRLETGAFIPSRKNVTSDKLEPFTKKMSEYYASIPKTSYVLDGVLDPSVYEVLNNGLQEIGLGKSTPEKVAAGMQAKLDAWKSKK